MTGTWDQLRNGSVYMLKEQKRRKRKVNLKVENKRRAAIKASTDFYDSKEWKTLRYKALKLHGARCQCCGATRKDDIQIHVDHVKPRKHFPALALDIGNLQVLCGPCNEGKGAWDQTDWR